MNRERRVEVKAEKCDLWSGGGVEYIGILSPLSLNGSIIETSSSGRSSGSGMKHQPYLDGVVFADNSILAYGDGQQIALHGLSLDQPQHDLLDKHHSQSSDRSNCSSTSSSGRESCSRESTTSTQSRRVRNETLDQRQERLRKNAERGKLRRMEETDEQRQRRLSRNAERGKIRRLEESQTKRQERLRKNAERQKMRRSKETAEERQLRLWKNAERQRIRRNSMPSTTIVDLKTNFEDYTGHEHLL